MGCGFPVRGTSLCMFQWVRHYPDGTRQYIEGATNPEYVVTADDIDKLIAVECIPMDDQGHQVVDLALPVLKFYSILIYTNKKLCATN